MLLGKCLFCFPYEANAKYVTEIKSFDYRMYINMLNEDTKDIGTVKMAARTFRFFRSLRRVVFITSKSIFTGFQQRVVECGTCLGFWRLDRTNILNGFSVRQVSVRK